MYLPIRKALPRKRVLPKQRAVFTAAGKIENDIAKYLERALKDLRDSVSLRKLAKILPSATDEEIFKVLHASGIDVIATGLSEELGSGLAAGAKLAAKDVGKVAVLDMLRPKVTEWLKEYSAELVKGIDKTSREALRKTIEDGVLRGRSPMQMAKDLQRSLGLTERQAGAVLRKREALEAAGIKPDRIETIINQYSNKLLKQRAEVIARTESIKAINQGRKELWGQLVEDGAISPKVIQEWITAEDERVCPICAPMDGQRKKIGENFIGGDGSSTDVPPIHPNCRCTVVLVEAR